MDKSIVDLGVDLLELILVREELSIKDVINFCSSSKDLLDLKGFSSLWREKCTQRYNIISIVQKLCGRFDC